MIVTTSARRTSKRANPDPVVLIRSSAYNSLPAPGNRVGTGDAANMAKIVAPTTNPAITAASGAHHYRFVGIEITPASGQDVTNLIMIGNGTTALANFPTDITFDRCYIHNGSGGQGRRGMWLDVIRGAVIDCYVSNFYTTDSSDSHPVLIAGSPGPFKFVNNYFEAASEGFISGGSDPQVTNVLPEDIEIRRNHFYKTATWLSDPDYPGYTVKNSFELKNARRVLIEGNVFENNSAGGQNGCSILFTVRNQDGGATWSQVADITFRRNKIINVEGGFNITGTDSDFTSQDTTRITIEDNFMELTRDTPGGDQRIMQLISVGNGASFVEFLNNTFIINSALTEAAYGVADQATYKGANVTWRDNIFSNGAYGFFGNGTGDGNATIDGHFTSETFTYNAIIGGTSGNYSGRTGCVFPANVSTVAFTNTATGDYSLSGSSPYLTSASDGGRLGADWTALNAAVEHAVDGQWGSEPATYSDRSYTNAELPRTYIDTTYAAQSGNLWTATNTSSSSVAGTGTGNRTGCSLTYALANCAVGDTIELTAGATYSLSASLNLRNI